MLESRSAALAALAEILHKSRPLDEALAAGASLEARERAFMRQLVMTCLRRQGQLRALIGMCLDRPLGPELKMAELILQLGAAQLLFLDTADHAAIDTSVELAKISRAKQVRGAFRMVNAVLRRLQREGDALRAPQDAARLNTPDWLWDSWVSDHGEDKARAIASAHLAEPPLDLTLKAGEDPNVWAARLGGHVLPNGSLRLSGGRVEELPGYADGSWWVQDAAASLPASLLGDVADKCVIDLCAAPGGKTAQLAASGAHVTAVDRSKARLQRLRENLQRLQLTAEIITADAAVWRPDAPVDAVLLDAPCSATGTLRRHPDLGWTKGQEDVAKLSALQHRLLSAAAEMLKPGGTLVYCTCSLQKDEAEALLAQTDLPDLRADTVRLDELPDAALITDVGHLRSWPFMWADQGGMDGFFAARFIKL